ncbi:conserved exported hypothetical protein [Crenothrix polyspora]|uniref:DUF7939 domain-containing protein n=1 Tax=Crenothrix polyspora TaxID=360316 RepID=A0A1R4GYW9_9GAMM|nr:BatD family protein [Crenothrix polyspora]SJM89174.1 conserved exported hypothetical protein [Crenothrix polyspora]
MNATKLMKSTLFPLLFLALWLPHSAFAVQIDVTLDRTPVSLDESFQIIFTAADTPDDAPDFSPLEQDFSILNQSQSSNTVFVNGNLSKTVQWTLNVMAKHAGQLTIPAIKFGDDVSQATSVAVTKNVGKKGINSDSELFLEVKATPETSYVQSQVLYTMRLYTKSKIAQAKLTEPELNDAVIEKLGEDSNYNTLYNGTNYEVVERKYVIFPQKSGELTINPLELTADVITDTAPGFNDFFSSQTTKTKRVVSKKVVLNVKPVPSGFTGQHWIAAEQLDLKQEWSGDTQQVKVGEPLTRTLTIQAKSATVAQLPELNTAKASEQLKVYPDQPVLQEQKKPDGLLSLRQEKIALIPSQAGSYTLPAIEIPWFNTQSQKVEIASLPQVTITVLGATSSSEATLVTPVVKAEKSKSTSKKTEAKPVQQTQGQPHRSYNKWLWAACVFFAAGWLITVVYFFAKRSAKKPVMVESESDVNVKECIKRLKKACANNDVEKAKEALMEWGHKQFGVTSLGAVATFCEARLRDEILHLNQILYGKDAEQWDGKKLFQYFIENKARTAIANKDSSLEPLYRL